MCSTLGQTHNHNMNFMVSAVVLQMYIAHPEYLEQEDKTYTLSLYCALEVKLIIGVGLWPLVSTQKNTTVNIDNMHV